MLNWVSRLSLIGFNPGMLDIEVTIGEKGFLLSPWEFAANACSFEVDGEDRCSLLCTSWRSGIELSSKSGFVKTSLADGKNGKDGVGVDGV